MFGSLLCRWIAPMGKFTQFSKPWFYYPTQTKRQAQVLRSLSMFLSLFLLSVASFSYYFHIRFVQICYELDKVFHYWMWNWGHIESHFAPDHRPTNWIAVHKRIICAYLQMHRLQEYLCDRSIDTFQSFIWFGKCWIATSGFCKRNAHGV